MYVFKNTLQPRCSRCNGRHRLTFKEFIEVAQCQTGNWIHAVLFKDKYIVLAPQWLLLYADGPRVLPFFTSPELPTTFQSAVLGTDNEWLCLPVSYHTAMGCSGHLFAGSYNFMRMKELLFFSFCSETVQLSKDFVFTLTLLLSGRSASLLSSPTTSGGKKGNTLQWRI